MHLYKDLGIHFIRTRTHLRGSRPPTCWSRSPTPTFYTADNNNRGWIQEFSKPGGWGGVERSVLFYNFRRREFYIKKRRKFVQYEGGGGVCLVRPLNPLLITSWYLKKTRDAQRSNSRITCPLYFRNFHIYLEKSEISLV